MMLRRFMQCKKGAAAAEMALILPFALLLLFAALETGHYVYQRHQVVKGLRDGARFAARQSFDDINCRSGTASTIPNAVRTEIISVTRTGALSASAVPPRIPNWAATDITVGVTCPAAAESQTGMFDPVERAAIVTVSTTFSYNSLFNGLGIFNDSLNLMANQQSTVMGI